MSFVAFKTITRKEIYRILRIWIQTLVPPVITISLYFLIFGTFIGSQVSDVKGISYIQFIVPGLVMMAVLQNAYANVVSSFFGSKFQRSVEELLVSPTPNWVIVLGYVVGGMFRGLAVGAIVLVISLLFTSMMLHNVWIILLFAILTSAAFSLGGFLNSIYAKRFDDLMIIPTFVLTPLTYLGGVFYSIDLLPPFWQAASKFNPLLYVIDGFRFGFLGVSDINVMYGVSLVVVFTVVLFVVCVRLLDKGVGLRS